MRGLWVLALAFTALALHGCTTVQRLAHAYSAGAPQPQTFQYEDGGASLYYAFTVGASAQPDTVLFFYGGSGCPSWKHVMPDYVEGLGLDARVFVLNKRFVADRSTGMFGCSDSFHRANNPAQWMADSMAFVTAQTTTTRFRQVVLVGVSEGALPALQAARRLPQVTHLAVIGSGGYSMRQSLTVLRQRGAIGFDVEAGWKKVSADPHSIDRRWYGNPYRWWSDIMDIDPMADALALDIPILVGIGELDASVPVESARYLESRFRQVGKSNLVLAVYPGADHRLNAGGVPYRGAFFATLGRMIRSSDGVKRAQKISSVHIATETEP